MKKIVFLLAVICTWGSMVGNTYTIATVPNVQLKDASRFVSNPDNLISTNAESVLNGLIREVRDSTTAEIAVVLLESIGYEDIDNFATELFTEWGIGKKEKDNGLLLLLVNDQRQMVFRTGYGLEGVLPDVILARIIRNRISPLLKEGDYDQAIITGMNEAISYLSNPEAIEEIYAEISREKNNNSFDSYSGSLLFSLVLSFVFTSPFIIWIYSILKKKIPRNEKYDRLYKRRKIVILYCLFLFMIAWPFLVFYLILIISLRYKPFPCPRCREQMQRINKKEKFSYLNQTQRTEEKIKSASYDGWTCKNHHIHILPYKRKSPYKPCPSCKGITYFSLSKEIIRQATTSSDGLAELFYQCKNCGISEIKKITLPMIVYSSYDDNGSGSSSGSSSSYSGGSSSGSSSGGSYGGGSTGGGGARGGW